MLPSCFLHRLGDRVHAVKEEQAVEMSSLSSRLGRKTIEVDGISKAYGDHVLFRDFSYIFLKNDRIGIIGRNGCGKSTLLRVITGRMAPDAGSVEFGSTVKVAYFAQENEELDERQKAIEYVREGAEYIRTKDGVVTASAMLERFLFDGEKQWTQISRLSGGEKRRLYLLRLLMEAPNVLVLDEPLAGLDKKSQEGLIPVLKQLHASGKTLLISTHNDALAEALATRTVQMENGKIR